MDWLMGFTPTDEKIASRQGSTKWRDLFDAMSQQGIERVVKERDVSERDFMLLYKSLTNSARQYNAKLGNAHVCVSKRGDRIYVEVWRRDGKI